MGLKGPELRIEATSFVPTLVFVPTLSQSPALPSKGMYQGVAMGATEDHSKNPSLNKESQFPSEILCPVRLRSNGEGSFWNPLICHSQVKKQRLPEEGSHSNVLTGQDLNFKSVLLNPSIYSLPRAASSPFSLSSNFRVYLWIFAPRPKEQKHVTSSD